MLKHSKYLLILTICLFAKVTGEIGTFFTHPNAFPRPNAYEQEACENESGDESLISCLRGLILVGDSCYLNETGYENARGLEVVGLEICDNDWCCLQNVLEPIFLNQPLTQNGLIELKKVIIAFYQDRGYPVVDVRIPEQEITCGVLQLLVVEGRVGDIRCCGNKWFSSCHLCEGIRFCKGDLIDTAVLTSDIAWLNRNPFRHTDIVFTPGETPGTTDIELQTIDEKPYRIYVGWDDHGTEPIGTNRRFAGFTYGNLWGQGHILSYQYTTSLNFKNLHAHGAQYIVPLPSHHTLDFFGGYAETRDHIRDFHHKGRSYQVSGRYRIMADLSSKSLQEYSFGGDYKNTNNNLLFSDHPVFSNRVALSQIVLGYHYELENSIRDTIMDLQLFVSPGQWLQDQSNKNYEKLRPGAKNSYAYLLGSLENTFYLPYDLSFYSSFQAQGASQNLLPSEQFGLGGYDTVRGYEERQVNGDNAFLANFEVYSPRWSFLNGWKGFGSNCMSDSLYVLAFLDYGIAWNHKRFHHEKASQYLVGIGPGIRYVINPYFSLSLDWGIQLHKLGEDRSFKSRVHFSAIGSF